MKETPLPNLCRTFLLSVALGAALAACAQQGQVRGEPPQFSIDTIARQDTSLLVGVGVRNINDQSIDIAAVDLELRLDETELAKGRATPDVTVNARSREVLRIETRAHDEGLLLLDQLAAGEHTGLRWHMDLVVTDAGGRERQTEASGWLHGVPGQPDRFR